MATRYIFSSAEYCNSHRLLFQDTFTEQNFRMLFGLTLQVILRPWEKFLMGFKFTEVG